MASIIGALRVTLGLETAAFETGAKRAEARAKALGNDAEALGQRIGATSKAFIAAGAAIVGSQVFAQVQRLVTQGLEYASALGEQAQQLGVTTKALQEYRYAGSQAGLTSDEMDTALSQLTRRLGEAANGTKAQAEAFARLGVNIRDANGNVIDAGEAIPLIAEGLKNIQSPAERATVLMDLFGKSGQKLEPLLADGARGVNGLRDAAHELGIVLTPEQIARADEAADKYAALQQVLSARIAGIVADNAGAIIEMVASVERLIEKFNDLMALLNRFAASPAGKVLQMLNTAAGYMNPVQAVTQTLMRTGEIYDAAQPRGSRPPSAPVTPMAPGAAFRAPAAPMPSLPKGMRMTTPSTFMKPGLMGGSGSFFAQFEGGVAQPDEMARRMEALGGSFHKFGDELDDLKGGMVKVVPTAKELAQTTADMGRSMAGTVQGLMGALNGLAYAFGGRSMGGGFLGKLSAIMGLGSELGKLGLFGKGLQGSLLSGARAMGGPVNAGGLYLVGERGPELFAPGKSGSIIPNHALGGSRVEIVPSPYFDVVVDGRVQRAAPGIAQAGAKIANQRLSLSASRSLATR